MKSLAIAASAAFLLIGGAATAQTPGDRNVTPTVNLTLEQRHVIREIVKDLKVPEAPAEAEMSIGATVPNNVSLQAVPPEIGSKVPQIRSHAFILKDGRVAIVDPKDKKIVDVID
jgi:uncharacterized protein DUF1236